MTWQPARKVADFRWILEHDDVYDEAALIEWNPLSQMWMCYRCNRERCRHVQAVRRQFGDPNPK